MPTDCPICEQSIPSTASRCSNCGFPTGLAIEGLRAVSEPAPLGPLTEPELRESKPPPKARRRSPKSRSSQQEMAATIAKDLEVRLELIRQLGGEAPDVTSEMCQAALIEADGRGAEALQVLRTAQARLHQQTGELFEARIELLQDRERMFQEDGLQITLAPEVTRLRVEYTQGNRESALALLATVDQRVAQFETNWKGVKAMLVEIQQLRDEAVTVNAPIDQIDHEVAGIRLALQRPNLDTEALDAIAQHATQTLMLLHEMVPTHLEGELGRHEKTLSAYPEHHEPVARARRLHAEANRHLRKGRLSEAIVNVRELNQEILSLERQLAEEERKAREAAAAAAMPPPAALEAAVAAPAAAATVTAAGPQETETEALDRLLKKARSLAAQVRSLPADSDAAYAAAAEIRRATELLRARKLEEADQTLSHLMKTLRVEAPPR